MLGRCTICAKMITERRVADLFIRNSMGGFNFFELFKTVMVKKFTLGIFSGITDIIFSCGTVMDVGSFFFYAVSRSYFCCVL